VSDNDQLPPADIPVDQYTRAQADAVLAKMADDYRKANPGDEWTAGAEHSTAELKRLEKEAAKITADPVAAGLVGGLPSGVMVQFGPEPEHAIASQKLQSLVNDLRSENMLTDGAIREALLPHLHSVTPEEMAAALKLEGELHGDAIWRDKLLKGDTVARNQLVLLEIIKGLPVKPKAA
jgi:hypothetical protein